MDKLLLENENKKISEILKQNWQPYAQKVGDKHFTSVANVKAHIKFRQERGWEYAFKGDSDDPIVRLVGLIK